MMSINHSILNLVGNTPLVKIKRLNPNKVEIYAKLEYCNPTGSLKDRIAKYMIENAENEGKLTKDKIIIEPTSGNTGISLAFVARLKGYKLIAVMPENTSIEKIKILKAYGADFILTPKDEGEDGAIEEAKRIAKEKGYYMPNQFSNKYNVLAHYETTGKEIWEQTKGKITHFIAGVGTGGTIMGVFKKLKEKNPKIKVIGVEPKLGSHIEGLKHMDKYIPEIYNPKEIERVIVDEKNAIKIAKELAREEGLFVGISSGATMYVALQKARKLNEGLIVVIFGDGGERYLSLF